MLVSSDADPQKRDKVGVIFSPHEESRCTSLQLIGFSADEAKRGSLYMSYLKFAACAAVVASTLVSANVAFAGNGGVSGSAPGKSSAVPPGHAKAAGSPATGIGQSNPNSNGGVSASAPGKNPAVSPPGQAKAPGTHAIGIGQANPNKNK